MKKIIAIALALTGISGIAHAESINFSGTITTSCAFSNASAGELLATGNGTEYQLASGFGAGSGIPATVDIAYSGSPTFAINAVPTVAYSGGGSAPTPTSITTGIWFTEAANTTNAVNAGADSFTSGTKVFSLNNSYTTETARVRMAALSTTPFPTGTYTATTTVTCQ